MKEPALASIHRSVVSNSAHGIIGFLVPAVIILISFPILIEEVGVAGFGVLQVGMAIGGFVLLLDFGFNAATIHLVAQDFGAGRLDRVAGIMATSGALIACMGLVGAGMIWMLAPWLTNVFAEGVGTASDVVLMFRLIGLQFVVLSQTLLIISFFKGMQQFARSSALIVLNSALSYGSASVMALVGALDLSGVAFVMLAGHIIALVVGALLCLRNFQTLHIPVPTFRPTLATAQRLWKFGAAVLVARVAIITSSQIQRLLVGATLGPTAVTLYTVPVVLVTNVHAAVSAASEVLFPFTSAMREVQLVRYVYWRMIGGGVLLAAPVLVILALFAEPIITLWINPDVAGSAAPMIPILCIAVLFMTSTVAPYHVVNGVGLPWLNTTFHFISMAIMLVSIAGFYFTGLSVQKFVWAFAIAQVLPALAFHFCVEMILWRQRFFRGVSWTALPEQSKPEAEEID